MKNVTYSSNLQEAPELYAKAQEATKLLDQVLGAYAGQVMAEWDCSKDERGRPLVSLRIADWTGAHSADLAPWELEQPGQLRFRLYHLWGDLLQERSEKQLKQLQEAAGAGE